MPQEIGWTGRNNGSAYEFRENRNCPAYGNFVFDPDYITHTGTWEKGFG